MTAASRLAQFMPNGLPRYVHVYDNGGTDKPGGTCDRYTVVFTGHYRDKTGEEFWYLGMSGAPFHPQGIGQHGSSQRQIDHPSYGHLGRKIAFADLPDDCQRCALQTYRNLWDLPNLDAAKTEAASYAVPDRFIAGYWHGFSKRPAPKEGRFSASYYAGFDFGRAERSKL